jgi:hypothetical protein
MKTNNGLAFELVSSPNQAVLKSFGKIDRLLKKL